MDPAKKVLNKTMIKKTQIIMKFIIEITDHSMINAAVQDPPPTKTTQEKQKLIPIVNIIFVKKDRIHDSLYYFIGTQIPLNLLMALPNLKLSI